MESIRTIGEMNHLIKVEYLIGLKKIIEESFTELGLNCTKFCEYKVQVRSDQGTYTFDFITLLGEYLLKISMPVSPAIEKGLLTEIETITKKAMTEYLYVSTKFIENIIFIIIGNLQKYKNSLAQELIK